MHATTLLVERDVLIIKGVFPWFGLSFSILEVVFLAREPICATIDFNII